jgi:hypothetical protein
VGVLLPAAAEVIRTVRTREEAAMKTKKLERATTRLDLDRPTLLTLRDLGAVHGRVSAGDIVRTRNEAAADPRTWLCDR